MRPFVLALVVACGDPSQGTAVGNPGLVDLVLADHPPDEVILSAELPVARITLHACERGDRELELDRTFDLLASDPEVMPGGAWCRTMVEPSGPVKLERRVGAGPIEHLELPAPPFELEGRYEVDGDHVYIGVLLFDPDQVGGPSGAGVPLPDPLPPGIDGPFVGGGGLVVSEDAREDGTRVSVVATYGVSGCAHGPSAGGFLRLVGRKER